jgi:hypothetical protein
LPKHRSRCKRRSRHRQLYGTGSESQNQVARARRASSARLQGLQGTHTHPSMHSVPPHQGGERSACARRMRCVRPALGGAESSQPLCCGLLACSLLGRRPSHVRRWVLPRKSLHRCRCARLVTVVLVEYHVPCATGSHRCITELLCRLGGLGR